MGINWKGVGRFGRQDPWGFGIDIYTRLYLK